MVHYNSVVGMILVSAPDDGPAHHSTVVQPYYTIVSNSQFTAVRLETITQSL
jgi:hypothetical protein